MSILCEFKDEDGSDIGLERAHSFPLGLVGWRGEEATEVGEVPIGLRPLATDRSMTHVNIDVSILDDENKKVYIVNLAPLSDLRLIEVRVLSGPDRMTQPHIFFPGCPFQRIIIKCYLIGAQRIFLRVTPSQVRREMENYPDFSIDDCYLI